MDRNGVAELERLASGYTVTHMGWDMVSTGYVMNDPGEQRQVAAWFDSAVSSPQNMSVRHAYAALATEVRWQYDFLRDAGYRFEPFGDDVPDPYNNRSDLMRDDLRENRHLWVYDGGNDHPLLSRFENWMFRAVHDCFGHAAQGFSFGPRGEYNAAIEHGKMFGDIALGALFTETHGQNSWVNYGPFADVPRADRPFAEQKAVVMPRRYRPV